MPPTRTRECGQSLVELALMLPALLLVVFGTVDFGRALYCYVMVSGAAQTGAEYAGSHNTTDPGLIRNVVLNEAGLGSGTPSADVAGAVRLDPAPAVVGGTPNLIRVTVVYNFQPVTPIPFSGPGGAPAILPIVAFAAAPVK